MKLRESYFLAFDFGSVHTVSSDSSARIEHKRETSLARFRLIEFRMSDGESSEWEQTRWKKRNEKWKRLKTKNVKRKYRRMATAAVADVRIAVTFMTTMATKPKRQTKYFSSHKFSNRNNRNHNKVIWLCTHNFFSVRSPQLFPSSSLPVALVQREVKWKTATKNQMRFLCFSSFCYYKYASQFVEHAVAQQQCQLEERRERMKRQWRRQCADQATADESQRMLRCKRKHQSFCAIWVRRGTRAHRRRRKHGEQKREEKKQKINIKCEKQVSIFTFDL